MNKIILFFLIAFVVGGCIEPDPLPVDVCDTQIIFSEVDFEPNNMIGIFANNIDNDGYCISMDLAFSGCDDNHEFSLITDGKVDDSLPPQLTLTIRDDNLQDCDAVFNKFVQFDLTPQNEKSVFAIYDEIVLKFKGKDVQYIWKK